MKSNIPPVANRTQTIYVSPFLGKNGKLDSIILLAGCAILLPISFALGFALGLQTVNWMF